MFTCLSSFWFNLFTIATKPPTWTPCPGREQSAGPGAGGARRRKVRWRRDRDVCDLGSVGQKDTSVGWDRYFAHLCLAIGVQPQGRCQGNRLADEDLTCQWQPSCCLVCGGWRVSGWMDGLLRKKQILSLKQTDSQTDPTFSNTNSPFLNKNLSKKQNLTQKVSSLLPKALRQ